MLGGDDFGKVDVAERIERGTLGPLAEKTLVCVLTVQVDESRTDLGESADGGRCPVDVRARSAIGGNDTGQNDFIVGRRINEAPVDARFFDTVTHHSGLGATTNQKVDRLDDHRLAGTSFAGECGEPLGELESDRVDDTEIPDVQLGEH